MFYSNIDGRKRITLVKLPSREVGKDVGKLGNGNLGVARLRATSHASPDGRKAMRLRLNLTFFYRLYSNITLSWSSIHSFIVKLLISMLLCV